MPAHCCCTVLLSAGTFNWQTSPVISPAIVVGSAAMAAKSPKETADSVRAASASSAAQTDPAFQFGVGTASQTSFLGIVDPRHFPPSPAVVVGPHPSRQNGERARAQLCRVRPSQRTRK